MQASKLQYAMQIQVHTHDTGLLAFKIGVVGTEPGLQRNGVGMGQHGSAWVSMGQRGPAYASIVTMIVLATKPPPPLAANRSPPCVHYFPKNVLGVW